MFQKLLMTGGPSTSDFNKPSHGLKVCKMWLFPTNLDYRYFFWLNFIQITVQLEVAWLVDNSFHMLYNFSAGHCYRCLK